jgi:hypothetical protein
MSSNKHNDEQDDMEPEYDFTGATRGKYHEAYQRGYKVPLHKEDGTTEERDVVFPEGTVVLDPDVRSYFPTSEAVNRALRGLIQLVPRSQPPGRPSP